MLAWLVVALAGVTESQATYGRWIHLAALCCVVQLGAGVMWRGQGSAGRRHLERLPLLEEVALATGRAEVRADADVPGVLAGRSTAVLPRRGAAAVTAVAADGSSVSLLALGGVPLARLQCVDAATAAAVADRLAEHGLSRLPTSPRGGGDLGGPRPVRLRLSGLTSLITAFPSVLVLVAGLVFDRRVDLTPVPVAVGLAGALVVLADGAVRAWRRPAHGWGEWSGWGVVALLPVVLVLYTLALVGPLRDQLPREVLVNYALTVCALGALSVVVQVALAVRAPLLAAAGPLLAFPALTSALGVGLLMAGRGSAGAVAAVAALPVAVAVGVLASRRRPRP